MASFFDWESGVIEGVVQHHAPLETLLEPLQ
jgi:hypothetical protein